MPLNQLDDYKLSDFDNIRRLASKLYPKDLWDHEKLHLKVQLKLYKLEIGNNTVLYYKEG